MQSVKFVSRSGGPPLSPPEILTAAQAVADRLGKQTQWRYAFRHASPDPPLLVARLDRPGTYYYIAPFRIAGRLTGRIELNAQTGKYGEATGVVTPKDELSRYASVDDVWARVRTPLPESRSARPARPARMPVIEPILVWRPSLQSRTPFLPFHLGRIGRKVTYFRVDGKEFDDLFMAAGN